jgi:putative tryptophan/tyrosine transport system substrate-binding protein
MRLQVLTTVVVGSLVAAPWPAVAQQVARIGILSPTRCADAWVNAFQQGLRDLGLVEGSNTELLCVEAEGDVDRLPMLASELVGRKVDVLVSIWGTAAALAAKKATPSIPIVAAAMGDPVAAGIVESLAKPGGNITGISSLAHTLEVKRLELIKELRPTIQRVAVLWDPDNPYSSLATRTIQGAADLLGVRIVRHRVAKPTDLDKAFKAIAEDRPDALLAPSYLVVVAQRDRIAAFAAERRLPACFSQGEFVRAGGLMSYGIDYTALYARAAGYVDKILKGAKPARLPVEQPTKFRLTINLKTAKSLGLTIPPGVLLRADEVIE